MTAPPLDVAVAGAGEPALALLPGWCCDSSTLEPLAALLRPQYRTLAIDWRGSGRSAPAPPGYGLDDTIEDLRQTLVATVPDGAVLIGHSLGGRIALAFTERHPELSRAVILLDTVIAEPDDRVLARRAELDAPDWQRRLRARFLGLLDGPGKTGGDGLIERIMATPLEVARTSLAVADAVDTSRALANAQGPVLYVGATDPRAAPSQLRRLRGDLDYGQVVGSGHFVQLAVPEQVAPMIDRFLHLRLPSGLHAPDDGATVI